MFCSRCGKNNPNDNVFCEYCGQPIIKQEQPSLDRLVPGEIVDRPQMNHRSQELWQRVKSYLPIIVGVLAAIVIIGGAIAYTCVVNQNREASGDVIETGAPASSGASESESSKPGKNDSEGTEAASDNEDADSTEREEAASNGAASQGAKESSISSKPVDGMQTVASAEDDYVLPESGSRYYSESELGAFSDWELYLARNEIFARHGRMFSNDDLKNYFEAKSWYEPRYTPEEFDALGDDVVNEYEKANSQTILSIEQARNSQYVS